MRLPVRLILLLAIPLVAWLVLGTPTGSELSMCWLPLTVFLLFWILSLFQGVMLRLAGVDLDVYGNSIAWFGFVPCIIASVVGFIGSVVAIYGGEETRAVINSAPAVGLAVLWLVLTLVLPALFARRTLGDGGTRPIMDPRAPMQSSERPPRSMADFEQHSPKS